MHSRAIRRTIGVAALVGSIAALGANASNASAATSVKVTGLIWSDTNANNFRDAGEPGASGKRVVLTSADEGRTFWASRTTGTSGWWGVVVPPGSYNVKYEFSDRLGGLPRDLDDPYGINGAFTPFPAGAIKNMVDNITHSYRTCTETTGSMVYASIPPNEWHRLNLRTWLDKDADGTQDTGEPGVTRIKNTPISWMTDYVDIPVPVDTKTPSSWGYNTWWLPAGSCGFIQQRTATTAPFYAHTIADVGSDSTDSDFVNRTPGIGYCIGKTDVTVASGYIDVSTQPSPHPLTIQGRVWIDSNRNGRQDAGEPNAPDGMEVTTGVDGKYIYCPPTATAKTIGGKYRLVIDHTITCGQHTEDSSGRTVLVEDTQPAPRLYLDAGISRQFYATQVDIGSDISDNDGFGEGPDYGCEYSDIACVDLPPTGGGPLTFDFGIIPR